MIYAMAPPNIPTNFASTERSLTAAANAILIVYGVPARARQLACARG